MANRVYAAPGLSAEAAFNSQIWDICKRLSQEKEEFLFDDICVKLARDWGCDCPEDKLLASISTERQKRILDYIGFCLAKGYATNRVETKEVDGETQVSKVYFKMTGYYK